MAFVSIKNVLAQAALANPEQFEAWSKAWRVAAENGSQESLLAFFCRENGLSEELFLQRLSEALGWPYLDLPKVTVSSEAQKRFPPKSPFNSRSFHPVRERHPASRGEQPFRHGAFECGAIRRPLRRPVRSRSQE